MKEILSIVTNTDSDTNDAIKLKKEDDEKSSLFFSPLCLLGF